MFGRIGSEPFFYSFPLLVIQSDVKKNLMYLDIIFLFYYEYVYIYNQHQNSRFKYNSKILLMQLQN